MMASSSEWPILSTPVKTTTTSGSPTSILSGQTCSLSGSGSSADDTRALLPSPEVTGTLTLGKKLTLEDVLRRDILLNDQERRTGRSFAREVVDLYRGMNEARDGYSHATTFLTKSYIGTMRVDSESFPCLFRAIVTILTREEEYSGGTRRSLHLGDTVYGVIEAATDIDAEEDESISVFTKREMTGKYDEQKKTIFHNFADITGLDGTWIPPDPGTVPNHLLPEEVLSQRFTETASYQINIVGMTARIPEALLGTRDRVDLAAISEESETRPGSWDRRQGRTRDDFEGFFPRLRDVSRSNRLHSVA